MADCVPTLIPNVREQMAGCSLLTAQPAERVIGQALDLAWRKSGVGSHIDLQGNQFIMVEYEGVDGGTAMDVDGSGLGD